MKTNVQLLKDLGLISLDPQNIRPISSIDPTRVFSLGEKIAANQRRGAGYFGSGIEQALVVYQNGNGGFYLWNGQERWMAVSSLIDRGTDYKFVGLPIEVRDAPADIWESTRLQLALHDVDPINILDLTRRAAALHTAPLRDGGEATWQQVSDVMGQSPSIWSHYQNLLKLCPDLQDAVVNGDIRAQTAAFVGRKLPVDLQEKYTEEILLAGKSLSRLKALVLRILNAADIAEHIEVDETDQTDSDGEPVEIEYGEDETPEAEIDIEAAYLAKQVCKALVRLEALSNEGRLTGLQSEIDQLAARLLNLETQ